MFTYSAMWNIFHIVEKLLWYAEQAMRNAKLEETEATIKAVGKY